MKCLRCGTELTDSAVFCPRCSEVTSVPLPASLATNKKIVIPKRTPAQSIKKPEPKKSAKKERRTGPWLTVSILLLFLLGAMVLQGTYTYREKARAEAELSRLQSVEDECVRLTEKLRQSEQAVSDLEAELVALGSDAYLEARNDLKEAEKTIEELSSQLAKEKENVASLGAQLELLREKTDFLDAHIVFLQEDNTDIFHSFDCEKFTRNGYRAYNKQQALSLGYFPCPDCQ